MANRYKGKQKEVSFVESCIKGPSHNYEKLNQSSDKGIIDNNQLSKSPFVNMVAKAYTSMVFTTPSPVTSPD